MQNLIKVKNKGYPTPNFANQDTLQFNGIGF